MVENPQQKNEVSRLLNEAGVSERAFCDAIINAVPQYKRNTVLQRMAAFERDPSGFKDGFLKDLFGFLFVKRHEEGKPVVWRTPFDFSVHYSVFKFYLSKIPIEDLEGELDKDYVDSFLKRIDDLDRAIESLGREELEYGYARPSQYKEIIQTALKSSPLIEFLEPKYEGPKEHYLVFTTKKLHDAIRPGKERRRLWQNIRDPFFFTLCFDPTYQNKGIRCELWLYGNLETLDRWEWELRKFGLKIELRHENYLRCYSELFAPDPESLGEAVADFANDQLPELEETTLSIYNTLVQKENQ